MAGYNYMAGKSNNAVFAEQCGSYPATQAAKILKVPPDFLREHWGGDEWHHTSKYYNRTDYFHIESIQEWLDEVEGRKVRTSGRVTAAGVPVVESTGLFIAVGAEKFESLLDARRDSDAQRD